MCLTPPQPELGCKVRNVFRINTRSLDWARNKIPRIALSLRCEPLRRSRPLGQFCRSISRGGLSYIRFSINIVFVLRTRIYCEDHKNFGTEALSQFCKTKLVEGLTL